DLACVQSLPAANSRYVVINGLCWSMTTKSTIPKSHGMVSSGVGFLFGSVALVFHTCLPNFLSKQAYKHIFTSPSSVEKEVKATRSGNARIHGMTRITTASLAYVITQVR